jgi:hypothetical protein
MPDVYISKIERGVLNVGIDNLEKIGKTLEVSKGYVQARVLISP